MMQLLLTQGSSGANSGAMKSKAILPLLAGLMFAASGCVQVQAPEKPIEINLNINIKQEVVLSLKQDAEALIQSKPELFPQ
jgi:YnbE-like lipoprotein